MSIYEFTPEELAQIELRGSSPATVQEQIERFHNGFPWMKVIAPATPAKGIAVLDEAQAAQAQEYCDKANVQGKCKFVPASGAASRMFKDIFAGMAKIQEGKDVEAGSPLARLAEGIRKFAFYTPELFGEPSDTPEYRLKAAQALLLEPGLAYGSKPKGVLDFHRYKSGEVRTAFGEHLVEAQEYMRNEDGTANLVVTISPEHRPLFEAALAKVKDEYEKKYGIKYNVTFTYQDKATDTVAVDLGNKPFLDEDCKMLFRPAGHGALIYNLNNVDAELVSIKNIDNVANEALLSTTAKYKKVLMGKALCLRDRIFGYLRKMDQECSEALCDEIEAFLRDELCISLPQTEGAQRQALLRAKLDRPIRVCGMVRNQGEPGGGPFIVEGKDGSTNLQILESVQLNMTDESARNMLSGATHFNPVDLVCCLYDYKGQKFNLLEHVDPDAGFISSKSYQGRELKALELPGLWNGAMSDWNTLFVEVPLETFNPVKTVLDLLRPAHQ